MGGTGGNSSGALRASRRRFLRRLGWGGIAAFFAGSGLATARFFFPRVLFEPPARFLAGRPADYPLGTVDSRYKDRYRVWVVRKEDGTFFCLKAECTHLGCTPNWWKSQERFKCPCHGSGFSREGLNFEGPAPRPLDRHRITLTAGGLILVDRSVVYRGIPGEDPDEIYPQSLLRV